MEIKEANDGSNFVERTIATSVIERAQRASIKIGKSQIDRNLYRKLRPVELSMAYIIRSMQILMSSGQSPEQVAEDHRRMVEMLTDITVLQDAPSSEKSDKQKPR